MPDLNAAIDPDPLSAEAEPAIRRASFPRRAIWTGSSVIHRWRERRAPFASREVLERRQRRRLRHIVGHAYLHVPYYRETMRKLGLTPDDLGSASELAKLPLIEREQLQRDPEYFVSELCDRASCLLLRSGGSTSEPVTVLQAPKEVTENGAAGSRVRSIVARLSGRRWRRRTVRIGPPMSSGARFARAYSRNLILPFSPFTARLRLSMQRSVAENQAAIDDFRPEVITGFGSHLEELFTHAVHSNRPFHLPKVVVYGADSLSPRTRELLSEQLGIEVLSVYQAIETPQIGFECERHRGHHLNLDLCPVRIVDDDGHELPPGEPGDVVISNLINRTTVLLNYRLGDVAEMLGEPCDCGRTLPLLSYVQGRTADWEIAADGRRLHTQLLIRPLSLDPEIWGYRMEQCAPGSFHAQVLAAPGADPTSVAARVKERSTRILGPEQEITLSFVDALPRTRGAKVRRVTRSPAGEERGPKRG